VLTRRCKLEHPQIGALPDIERVMRLIRQNVHRKGTHNMIEPSSPLLAGISDRKPTELFLFDREKNVSTDSQLGAEFKKKKVAAIGRAGGCSQRLPLRAFNLPTQGVSNHASNGWLNPRREPWYGSIRSVNTVTGEDDVMWQQGHGQEPEANHS